MSLIERWLLLLQTEMEEPLAWGWFHLLCIGIMLVTITILFVFRKKHNEKQLKIVIGTYGLVAFILELLKNISWSFNYDTVFNIATWDYTWYAFPFQLCTTPIYVCLICLFLKKCRVRDYMLSFVSFITIWGSIATILLPDSCLIDEILININTMWIHLASFVVSTYLIFSGEVEIKKENLFGAFKVFLVFVFIAFTLNIAVYNSGILNGETFDMFYISPYFTKDLPVFSQMYEILPYYLYLPGYILILCLGGTSIYYISKAIKRLFKKIAKQK